VRCFGERGIRRRITRDGDGVTGDVTSPDDRPEQAQGHAHPCPAVRLRSPNTGRSRGTFADDTADPRDRTQPGRTPEPLHPPPRPDGHRPPDGHSPAEPGAGSAHGNSIRGNTRGPAGLARQSEFDEELRETGGWGARLLPVQGARQDLDGMSRKPIRSGRRRRELRRRRGRHQAGRVLGG
jgi:hypothetical protein